MMCEVTDLETSRMAFARSPSTPSKGRVEERVLDNRPIRSQKTFGTEALWIWIGNRIVKHSPKTSNNVITQHFIRRENYVPGVDPNLRAYEPA